MKGSDEIVDMVGCAVGICGGALVASQLGIPPAAECAAGFGMGLAAASGILWCTRGCPTGYSTDNQPNETTALNEAQEISPMPPTMNG
ncbi:MAG: hypothetical protein K0R12_85 [Gammaproteobacteria bacterium]|nr:hypothetical protein [Gammaproteobacteria bacterium]